MTNDQSTCATCRHWAPWNGHPRCQRGTCGALFTLACGNVGMRHKPGFVRKGEIVCATTPRDFGCVLHQLAESPSRAEKRNP